MSEKTSFISRLSRRAQIALTVIGLLLIIGICAAAVGLYAHFSVTEGVYEFPAEAENLSIDKKLEDKNNLKSYVNSMITKASDSAETYVNKDVSLSVADDSITFPEEPDAKTGIVKFAKNDILSHMSSLYSGHEGSFNDGYSSIPHIELSPADIAEIQASMGTPDANGEMTNTDRFYFTFTTKGGNFPADIPESISETFSCDEIQGVVSQLKEAMSQAVNVLSYDITSPGFTVSGSALKNGELQELHFSRLYDVTLKLEFKGMYSDFGTKTISFRLECRQNYAFFWAGINIIQDKLILTQVGSDTLGVETVPAENPGEGFEITFSSSDESIATVGADGIVEAVGNNEAPAIITATLTYLGFTYTDTCEVYVINEVEKIVVSEDKKALAVGDEFLLSCVLTPEDATIKKVFWFSEDESIAKIDENGRVTAVGLGETKVFAVSEDGHFRDSCIVTVGEGA